jgi:HAD superfamily hydrolase (TIGR01450 family)
VNTTLAAGYDLVIFDLDGVVYVGEEAVPGAAEAIRAIVDSGIGVAFVTNNASRRPAEVAALLTSLGVRAQPDAVLTSGQAAAAVLADDLPKAAPVLVVGAPALGEQIREAGLTPVDDASSRPAAVVQGYGPEVGWAQLAEACVAIRSGAQWVATNTDATLPSPRGPLPGNGSLVAALSTALGGRRPDAVVGKPSPTLFQLAARWRRAGRVLVVGDRLDTDIEAANAAAMDSLLVLTGVSTVADVLRATARDRPTYIAPDCRALSTSADLVRVPGWDPTSGVARAEGWVVTRDADRLVLDEAPSGEPGALHAVRALAAAAWANPDWTVVTGDSSTAMRMIESLGLARYSGWSVSPASAV